MLRNATKKEREGLFKILDTTVCENDSPKELIKGLRWLNRNIFEDLLRDAFNKPETYKSILIGVCDHLDIEYNKNDKPAKLEGKISQIVLKKMWAKMTLKQKDKFESEIKNIAKKYGKSGEWIKAGGVTSALVAAELSGFSVYLLATSSLAAVSSGIGLTLPFAAYTSLTTTIGTILGPVGWVGVGLYTLLKISGANYRKLVPSVLYIAMLRNKQNKK
jgi:uncharacterized protein YaaW (UPF0174 family)